MTSDIPRDILKSNTPTGYRKDDPMKQKFDVSGMTCSACVAHVEKDVKKVKGVKKVNVSLINNSMTVDFEDYLTPQDIVSAVEKGGYGAKLAGAVKSDSKESTASIHIKNMK